MNITFCFDDAYLGRAIVAIKSLLINNRAVSIDIYVISSDLSSRSLAALEALHALHPNYAVHHVPVSNDLFDGVKPKDGYYLPLESCYRMALAELLPAVDKILYLDGDLMVDGDIRAFYDMDISNVLLAGVLDTHIRNIGYDRKIGVADYINSGVLLMNLAKMRTDGILRKFIACYNLRRDELEIVDQDLINLVCAGQIALAENRYNFTSTDRLNSHACRLYLAKIIHYTGRIKPWHKDNWRWRHYSCCETMPLPIMRHFLYKVRETAEFVVNVLRWVFWDKHKDDLNSTYYFLRIPVWKHLKRSRRNAASPNRRESATSAASRLTDEG